MRYRVGAMLETPSLAFAPQKFFEMCDFIGRRQRSEAVLFRRRRERMSACRRRYDTLNTRSSPRCWKQIVQRCDDAGGADLPFCGEMRAPSRPSPRWFAGGTMRPARSGRSGI